VSVANAALAMGFRIAQSAAGIADAAALVADEVEAAVVEADDAVVLTAVVAALGLLVVLLHAVPARPTASRTDVVVKALRRFMAASRGDRRCI
jgi:hypothetical protein